MRRRVLSTHLAHIHDKVLAVPVGDVDTDEGDRRHCRQDRLQPLKVTSPSAGAGCNMRESLGGLLGELLPLLDRVELVHAGEAAVGGEHLGHLEGAHGVHVGRHDRDPVVRLLRVLEHNLPVEVDLRKSHNQWLSHVYDEVRLTSALLFRVLLFGLRRTSLKSSLTSYTMFGILCTLQSEMRLGLVHLVY